MFITRTMQAAILSKHVDDQIIATSERRDAHFPMRRYASLSLVCKYYGEYPGNNLSFYKLNSF